MKHSCEYNDYTSLNLTKLDILDEFDEIKVAVSYKINGTEQDTYPASVDAQEAVEPVYQTFKGWKTSTTATKRWQDLPEQARTYVEFIEGFLGVPVKWIGVGPAREDMIVR
jgi:adenylosuccinate synthase